MKKTGKVGTCRDHDRDGDDEDDDDNDEEEDAEDSINNLYYGLGPYQ